ncbi:MAG TPA: DUF2459 domain-containing protein [Tepidisphaeraceae bacterium]
MAAGKRSRLTAGLIATLVASGCRSADPSLYPPRHGEPAAEAIVLDNHWHTALIFRSEDLPADLRSQLLGFADRRYVMVGWGDEGFFRAEEISPGLVAQALFYSRGSVMLVVGFDGIPEFHFADEVDIYRIPVRAAGRDRMIAAVSAAFRRSDGKVIDTGPGIDGGRFFAASGRYAFYRTCNHWTASMLTNAGLPITPAYAATAGNVAFQLRQLPGLLKNGRPIPLPLKPDAAALRLARGGRP